MKRRVVALTVAALTFGCGGGEGSRREVIQNKGSDTLVNVAQAWAEAYAGVDSTVAVAVTGGGSGTGISAMINGTVDIANTSREMTDSELESARANGIEPVMFTVGIDALAVFLHPDNPASSITLAQLKSIYGEGGEMESWSDLGLVVPGCSSDEIVRVSRQNNSGTFAYFRDAVLDEGDFKLGSRDMHGSKDVVDLVEHTPCAIGYSGLAYANEHVKTPCVISEEDGTCVLPSVDSALDGTYPIARPLMMYTAGQPAGKVKEYMDWIMSDAGQCILVEKGYAPIRGVECT